MDVTQDLNHICWFLQSLGYVHSKKHVSIKVKVDLTDPAPSSETKKCLLSSWQSFKHISNEVSKFRTFLALGIPYSHNRRPSFFYCLHYCNLIQKLSSFEKNEVGESVIKS